MRTHHNRYDPAVPNQALRSSLTVLACALVAAGCGGGERRGSATATATAPAASAVLPPLARAAAARGEIVVHGESSTRNHGPYSFDGRYVVRFEQTAPEDPQLDFGGQTPFTAALERRAGDPRGAVKLFSAAARAGRRELTLHGRYVLDVSFGDFPYAMRFTPRG
ncbi:MAG: hypothetical protein QOJ89_1061 [bacterium]